MSEARRDPRGLALERGTERASAERSSPPPSRSLERTERRGARPLLYVIGQLRSGGQERQLYYLIRELARQGRAVEVAVWNFDPEEPWVGPLSELRVPVHGLAGRGGPAGKICRLARLIRRIRAAVVHSYSFYTNFPTWAAAAAAATVPPTETVSVGSIRSTLEQSRRESGRILGALSSWLPSHQVANSRGAEREAASRNRLLAPSPARVHVVRNGVDLDRFPATETPSGVPLLAGVGSLVPVKRWDRFVAAAAELAARGIVFRAAIAGDGPLREWLAMGIRRARLEDRFSLLGSVEDVAAFLSKASVLVHTSDVEGTPNAVIEAMAAGRPVVAWDAGDVSEVVEPGSTGFVVSSPGELVERLAVLAADTDLRRRMGSAARARAETEFEIPRLAAETLAAYRAAGWRA